jgi:murein DD-endopeptidase MepM/ murein hydrolase activator NlpD
MRRRAVSCESRGVLKIVAAALLASAAGACSSDASRFGENPFTNPFSAAATTAPKVDRATTGSLVRTAPVAQVATQPLPPALPRAAANPLNPAQVAAAPVPAPARVASGALQQASPIAGSAAGWTAFGGTPVTVAPGETAATLSARYGVPVAAINAANGGAVRPGQQAIIPIYAGERRAAGPTPSPLASPARPAAAAEALQPEVAHDVPARSAPKVAAAPEPKPAAASKPVAPTAAPKPVAAAPAPTAGRIVAAAPKSVTPAVAAAKPLKPANPAKPADDDDDDEDEKPAPRKLAQAQPAPQPQPQAAQPPAQKPTQAEKPQRPQPRVIPLTPQPPKAEEPPQRVTQAPQVDTTTTQSIPTAPPKAAPEPAEQKADFRWPARGRVISGFGAKGGNGDGIAIAVPEGTPVKAASDGVVAYAGEELKGYGKLVLVRHDNGFVSAYAHNGELNVKRGEKVSRGQTIAKSGATGNVTSPQLHFELRKGSTPVDPTKYLDN